MVSSVEMEGKKSPDLSLEWKDLKIEIKVYGKVSVFNKTEKNNLVNKLMWYLEMVYYVKNLSRKQFEVHIYVVLKKKAIR